MMDTYEPSKKTAFEKIKKDLKIIFRNAEKVGKSFEDYLIDLKYEKDTVSYFSREIERLSNKEKEALGIIKVPSASEAKRGTEKEMKEPEKASTDPPVAPSRLSLVLNKAQSIEHFLKLLCLIVLVGMQFTQLSTICCVWPPIIILRGTGRQSMACSIRR